MRLVLAITELKAKLVDTSTKESPMRTKVVCWDVHFRGMITPQYVTDPSEFPASEIRLRVDNFHFEGDIVWYGEPDPDKITEHLHKLIKEQ
jgi:hypothetical protein